MSLDIKKYLRTTGKKQDAPDNKIYWWNNTDANIVLSKFNATPFIETILWDIIPGIVEKQPNTYIKNRKLKVQEVIKSNRKEISKKIVSILTSTIPSNQRENIEKHMLSIIDDDLINNKWNYDIKNLASKNQIQKELINIQESPRRNPDTYLIDYYQRFIAPHESGSVQDRWTVSNLIQELWGITECSDAAIVCWKIQIGNKNYWVIWHNKQYRWWRSSTEDHTNAIEYVKEYERKKLPIVFWIDTPGSESWTDANEWHQAKIMAELIATVGDLKVPSMGIIAWEWGSGGAQVFMWVDRVYAVNDSYFWTIHPVWHEGILKSKYSAKELTSILKLDVYNLAKYWVIDDIINVSPHKTEENTAKVFTSAIQDLIKNHFISHGDIINEYKKWLKASQNKRIQKLIWSFKSDTEIENYIRDNIKGAKLYRASSRMIIPRKLESVDQVKKELEKPRQHEKTLMSQEFEELILSSDQLKSFNEKELRLSIFEFIEKKFKDNSFTKFNITSNIESLFSATSNIQSKLEKNQGIQKSEKNNIIWFLREELWYIKTLFNILLELIDPKNYNEFFAKDSIDIEPWTGEKIWKTIKREKIEPNKWLEYKKEDVDKLLSKIYESLDINNIEQSEQNWRETKFGWIKKVLEDQEYVDWLKSLLKTYKNAHYDLPNVVTEMTWLLLEKFIQFIKNPKKYDPALKWNDNFKIDYWEKGKYEDLSYFHKVRKESVWRITTEMIINQYLSSFNREYSYKREQVNMLEEKNGIFKPDSSTQVWFGRIRWLKREKGIVIIDASVDLGAIDGSTTAAIINLIKETALRNVSVVMFVQSSGMNVNAGPEAVSSMSAISKAISDFHIKTNWKKKVVVVGMWTITGWTIASFVQMPWVYFIGLSLTYDPFAWAIVTVDQQTVESTVVDFQVKSGTNPLGIDGLVKNDFIDKSNNPYSKLQNHWIDIVEPSLNLSQYLIEHKLFEITDSSYTKPHPQAFEKIEYEFKNNSEIFKPFTKVAIHNRWIIAHKAQNAFRNLWIDFIQFTTDSDKKQNYVESKKVDDVLISDYVKEPREILKAIKDNWCRAIYLWYWFLSEDAEFIKECEKQKIVVIGPNSKNVYQMWDKLTARITSKEVLKKLQIDIAKYGPAKGSDDVFNDLKKDTKSYKFENNWIQNEKWEKIVDKDWLLASKEAALIVAEKIWYPVMLKARFWWGGKGIKFAKNEKDITENFDRLSSEAKQSFGNEDMYAEKAMENQMHIEVQVFADAEWNAVTMWLRNCSVQRRGQKLIEECGKMDMDPSIVKELEKFVRETTKEIQYVWAGTFEFLYDPEKKKFTFMEMNTRIQVEHTITERQLKNAWVKVSKMKELNLVELQTRLAMWETQILPKQKDIDKAFESWYTTEIRLCAEDPLNNFTGVQMAKIKNLKLFQEKHKWITSVHFESFLKEWENTWGNTWRWDSMIWQLIVSGKDRLTVAKYLRVALKKMKIEGIPVNKDFLVNILQSEEYKKWDIKINSVDKDMDWERKFFQWLKKFDGKIESVIDSNENFVHLKPWEYIVRTEQDFTIYTQPNSKKGTPKYVEDESDFVVDNKTPFYMIEVNKNFTEMNKIEWAYVKNSKWEEVPLAELWNIKITKVIPKNGASLSNWNALFIVKKV